MADKWLLTAEDSVLFGQLVLEKGLAQETAVKECLQEQDVLRKQGRMVPLSQLLVRKRALSPRNLPVLLRELKERLHSCSGCQAMFLLESGEDPEVFVCKRCGMTGVERPLLATEIPVSSKSSGELPVVHLPPKPAPKGTDFGDFSRFGEFEIEEEISRTPAGVTYRARHREEGKRVLLCVLTSSKLADEGAAEEVKEELEKLTRFRHRGIVRVFDVKVHMRQRYFTKEILSGRSLREVIREGQLLLSEKVRIIKELAEAVEYAHSQSLLHGHLVPELVFVDDDVHPKIAEMGRVRALVEAVDEALPYRAPEQIQSEKLLPATDVYCLGAMLFELLTGHPPFQGGYDSLIEAIASQEPPLPQTIVAEIDDALAGICLRALLKDPTERYPTAGSFAADLDRFLRGEPTSAASRKISRQAASSSDFTKSSLKSGSKQAAEPTRSPLKPLLAIGGVLLLLLGIGAFVLFGNDPVEVESEALQQHRQQLGQLQSEVASLLATEVGSLSEQTAESFLGSSAKARSRFEELEGQEFASLEEGERAGQLQKPLAETIPRLFLLEARVLVRPPSQVEDRERAKKLLIKARSVLTGKELLEAHNTLGEVFLQEGNVEFARKEFGAVLDRQGQDVQARYGLARIFRGERQWQQAAQLFEELRDEPSLQNEGRFWLQLGECFLELNQLEDAVSACAQADGLLPGLGWARFAEHAAVLGSEGETAVLRALQSVPEAEAAFARALFHLARERPHTALLELDLAEQAGLERAKAVVTRAETMEQVLGLSAVTALFTELANMELAANLKGRLTVLRGFKRWAEGDLETALRHLENGLLLSPEDSQAQLARLDLMLLHDFDDPQLRSWLETLNPLSGEPDLLLRKALLDREQGREYLDTLGRAADGGQLDAMALLLREWHHAGNPDVWKAQERTFLETRQRRASAATSFYRAAGRELFKHVHGRGDAERLSYALQRCLALSPLFWPARLLQAQATATRAGIGMSLKRRTGLETSGEMSASEMEALANDPLLEQARSELELVLEMHPTSIQALRLLASICLFQGEARELIRDRDGSHESFSRARACLLKLTELHPEVAEVWLRLSEASLSLGEQAVVADVEAQALKAYELDPYNLEVARFLWQLALLSGSQADADRWQAERNRLKEELARVPALLEEASRLAAGNQLEEALAQVQAVLDRDPDRPRALDLYSQICAAMGSASVEDGAMAAVHAALLDPTYAQAVLARGRGLTLDQSEWPIEADVTALRVAQLWAEVEKRLLEGGTPAALQLEAGLALGRQLNELAPASPLGLLFQIAFQAAAQWLDEAQVLVELVEGAPYSLSQKSGLEAFLATVFAASGHYDAAQLAIGKFEAAGGSVGVLRGDPAFARMNQ